MKKITLFMLIVFTIATHGQNKLLSSVNEYYNGGTWQNSWGHNYEYDSNNNLITEIYLNWVDDAWKIREKVTYTYNASNKVTQEIGQDWDDVTNKLENSYRDTYTYTDGKITGQVAEIWENSSWVNEWKNNLTYSNNLPISLLSYDWDGTNWVAAERGQFNYNANNKLIEELYDLWENSQWIKSNKSLYAYNANNQMLNSRYGEWDDFNNLYEETYKTDYVLDATGNRISETSDQINNNYKYKGEYTYDSFSLMSNFAHPFKDKSGLDYITEDFPYVNKLLTENQYYFDTATNSYKLSSRTTYNYDSPINLSLEQPEIVNVSITVSPNPTTSIVNLNFPNKVTIDKVAINDIAGRIVLQQDQNTAQINVEKLTPGLYIIEMFSGNEKFTSKFVKK